MKLYQILEKSNLILHYIVEISNKLNKEKTKFMQPKYDKLELSAL
jgi:hypothetical protein